MTWTPSPPPRDPPSPPPTPDRQILEQILGAGWSPDRAFEHIEAGLTPNPVLRLFDHFGKEGVLATLAISPRTFDRRRHEGRLKAGESDRLYRLVRLYALAADVFGDAEAARTWMAEPAVALGDRTPLAYARNEAGAQRIEDLLLRIEHGVYG